MSEKAVAVAKDVLLQLQAGRLDVGNGVYLEGWNDTVLPLDDDAGTHADVIQESCEVCLLGAALISKARLYDGVPLKRIAYSGGGSRKTQFVADKEEVVELLAGVFSPEQCDLMEAAFELSVTLAEAVERGSQPLHAAVAFGRRYASPTARLEAIMRNVVEYGEFRPDHATPEEDA